MGKSRFGKILYCGTSFLASLMMAVFPAVVVSSNDVESAMEEVFVNKEASIAQAFNTKNENIIFDDVEKTGDSTNAVKVIDNQTTLMPQLSRSLSKRDNAHRTLWVRNENREKLALRYPEKSKEVSYVPDWSLAALLKLADYGLLKPNDIHEMLEEPNREFMGKMISRAYNMNEKQCGENYEIVSSMLSELMDEYDTELRNLGYYAAEYANYTKPAVDLSTKVGGELRYHYVDHNGDKQRNYSDRNYDFYDQRLRLRLYLEQPINEDWSVYGMCEAEKSWAASDIDDISLERLYLSGKHKNINIKAGRFGKFYADGNVYDGNYEGVSLIFGDKTKYKLEKGKLRDGQDGVTFMLSHEMKDFDFEAGLYSYEDIKTYGKTTISSLGGMYYAGNFGLGAMWLHSDKESFAGEKDGYVFTLKYGRNRSWQAGTYEVFARYYNQPDSTYFAHTMVGLADYMTGFKGYGAGLYYTLAENVIYGLEYYDLENKPDGRKARTVWAHVSLYF